MDRDAVVRAAKEELRKEAFEEAVTREVALQRKRMALPLWRRLFPYTIKIERIDT